MSPRDDKFRRALEAFVGVTFLEGNSVQRLRNGVEIFPAMLEAIRLAERRIDFVTFVYWTGDIARQMATALAERARAGISVRVLLDAVGAHSMDTGLVQQMEDSGVEVAWFRPVTRWKVWEIDHRTHRKILVVDDQVAFTGGVGIAAEWEGDARDPSEWRDSHFAVRGPAIDPLRSAFVSDWRDAAGEMFRGDEIPARPAPAGDVALGVIDASAEIELNTAGRAFEAVVAVAEHRLWIATPYFNPSERLTQLLVEATERGVEVRLMIPGDHIDKRVSLISAQEQARQLVEVGVALHRYQRTMLHLKQLVADESLAMFGSVNFNERSLFKDEEVATVAIDSSLNRLLADDFVNDLDACEVVLNPDELHRSTTEKMIGKLTTPFQGEM
ncbi:MAG TPA: phospholipase D-like domain-containing protein [Acidimicrobiia bacterium]|nr:phospholipase D-like domain-containing protein [Acidimicrobiia bacterium]